MSYSKFKKYTAKINLVIVIEIPQNIINRFSMGAHVSPGGLWLPQTPVVRTLVITTLFQLSRTKFTFLHLGRLPQSMSVLLCSPPK